jgi:hypothetical protein
MPVKKNYTEAEMIDTFGLTRLVSNQTPRMEDWLDAELPVLTPFESYLFDKILDDFMKNSIGWNEQKMKMNLLAPLFLLSHLEDTDKYVTFYDKKIENMVENTFLSVKIDFMVATGLYDIYKKPYFYFQKYKAKKDMSTDSMGELLQAMLIAQAKNKDGKPIFACELINNSFNFVILEGKEYCISTSHHLSHKHQILAVIAILRKFKHILETELIVD